MLLVFRYWEASIVVIDIETVNKTIQPKPVRALHVYCLKVSGVDLNLVHNGSVHVVAVSDVHLQVDYDDEERTEQQEGYDLSC